MRPEPTMPESTEVAPASRIGFAGWLRGLSSRLSEPDIRQAAGVTVAAIAAVLIAGNPPLEGEFDLDLRAGDTVGGWNQVTLVGFSIARPFGRVLPDRPGRSDLRIISNRPLPAHFELELEAWTLRPGHPVSLEVSIGDERQSTRFGADETIRRLAFENVGGQRALTLVLGPADKLAVRRISVIEAGDAR